MSEAHERFRQLLRERSFARKQVTLASGKTSDWFLDCKQTVLGAEGHALAGTLMREAVRELATSPVAVAGVALGGCPLASAVALVSCTEGPPLDAIYVRKQAKDHGSERLIEGDDRLSEHAPIAVLEDVVTSGGSTLRAIEVLRRRPFEVAGVVAVVDRSEGGRAAIESAGVPFLSLYTRADFMAD